MGSTLLIRNGSMIVLTGTDIPSRTGNLAETNVQPGYRHCGGGPSETLRKPCSSLQKQLTAGIPLAAGQVCDASLHQAGWRYNRSTSIFAEPAVIVRIAMSSLTVVPAQSGSPSMLAAEQQGQRPSRGIFASGPLFIGAASLFLSLATAVECSSITHIPSLIYGLVLWGWW